MLSDGVRIRKTDAGYVVETLDNDNVTWTQLGSGGFEPIDPLPARPTTSNEIIALLVQYGLCALLMVSLSFSQVQAADFGDIPASLAMPAGTSVRRNAGNTAFETFSPSKPRVTTITSSATPTINTDNCDAVTITALAVAITSMTTNLSGTPNNFDRLIIRFKDDGTPHAIAWGASFVDGQIALPITTVAGKTLDVGLIYDSVRAKWVCKATDQQP